MDSIVTIDTMLEIIYLLLLSKVHQQIQLLDCDLSTMDPICLFITAKLAAKLSCTSVKHDQLIKK